MTDLSLATHEEIIAEIARRYPCHVVAVIHRAEGQTNPDIGLSTRIDFCAKRGFAEAYGLAMIAVESIRARFSGTSFSSTGIPPLDPPFKAPSA